MAVFVDWKGIPDGEIESFTFGVNLWSVYIAKHLLGEKPRKSQILTVADWRGVAELSEVVTRRGTVTQVGGYRAKDQPLEPINLEVPVICTRFGRGHLPIDGWRRIRHALEIGRLHLPCVHLNTTESKECSRTVR